MTRTINDTSYDLFRKWNGLYEICRVRSREEFNKIQRIKLSILSNRFVDKNFPPFCLSIHLCIFKTICRKDLNKGNDGNARG